MLFTIIREDTCIRFEKYSSKLNFVEFRPRSVEKINFLYILSLKLDISCSLICIFAIIAKILSFAERNIQVNLIFSCSLIRIFAQNIASWRH